MEQPPGFVAQGEIYREGVSSSSCSFISSLDSIFPSNTAHEALSNPG